jgi:hypothetical protein
MEVITMKLSTNSACWQFIVRQQQYGSDLEKWDLTVQEQQALRVSDFSFRYIPKEDKESIKDCHEFIKTYEYLGKIAQRNSHHFGSYYKGMLAGVQILSTPNAFSNLLGPDTWKIEKLFSRGACAAISCPNLGSWQIMNTIRWMVKNTPYRIFSGYADPRAHERGRIYSACNFFELKGKFGGSFQLFDPNNPERGWFSDREARKPSAYRRFAKELNIEWQTEWLNPKGSIQWKAMPPLVEEAIRLKSKLYVKKCESRKLPPKRKFIYLKGRSKAETRALFKRLYENNPFLDPKGPKDRSNLPYSKEREH